MKNVIMSAAWRIGVAVDMVWLSIGKHIEKATSMKKSSIEKANQTYVWHAV